MKRRKRTTLVERRDPLLVSRDTEWYRKLSEDHLSLLQLAARPMGCKLPSLRLDMGTFKSDLDQALSACIPSFKLRYLQEEIWSKYLDERLVPAKTRRTAAIEKFLAAEEHNRRTNIRLYAQYDLMGVDFHVFVEEVRAIVARVLGPISDVDLSSASFTNGAAVGIRKSSSARLHKLQGKVRLSSSASFWWMDTFSGTIVGGGVNREGATPLLGLNLPLEPTEGSVYFTVPKKTEIDRSACKEPAGNALLQRAVGEHIATRLKSVNIDLHDQRHNQRGAYLGSLRGDLATIDLSSASDTMTTSLAAVLLPGEWWSLLDDLRVHSTTIDGANHALEMFSSMGNGFTFELETLFFLAISKATMDRLDVSGPCLVYGDDIIIPSAACKSVLRNLRCFGFIPNAKKTHFGARDLFRESCGKHYHTGLDVSPFYIRGPVRDLSTLMNVLNSLLEWDGRGVGFFVEPTLLDFWVSMKESIPPFLWGGVDTDDPSSLVTGNMPRLRMTSIPKTVKLRASDHLPAFVSWLMEKRHAEKPISVDPADQSGRHRVDLRDSCWGTTSWKPTLTQEA